MQTELYKRVHTASRLYVASTVVAWAAVATTRWDSWASPCQVALQQGARLMTWEPSLMTALSPSPSSQPTLEVAQHQQ